MLGYHAFLTWFDSDGVEHRLVSWSSREGIGGRTHRSTINAEGQPVEPYWYGLVSEEGVVSMVGGGYPYRYTLRPEALIEVLSTVRPGVLQDLSHMLAPVDTERIIAALRALPADTLVHAEEWDQS